MSEKRKNILNNIGNLIGELDEVADAIKAECENFFNTIFEENEELLKDLKGLHLLCPRNSIDSAEHTIIGMRKKEDEIYFVFEEYDIPVSYFEWDVLMGLTEDFNNITNLK